ncbi:MAG: peptidoglycan editing factor PgeF, partial [Thermodesulfobacteriota bacterium]|nr:peptidoglycan editing factor PgeF [Thermodesulfobacteriota bacterium]
PLRGSGATDYTGAINATDAMVTGLPEICLMVFLADCVPLLIYDPTKRVVGVAHAGWKGTLQSIAEKTVHVFRRDFGSSPQDMVAAIGPSIGPCCYEVGQPVISQIEQLWKTKDGCVEKERSQSKRHLDLWEANRRQLVGAGIPNRNIEIARICTNHHPDLFFSYRHEKGKTGRFGAGIFLRR